MSKDANAATDSMKSVAAEEFLWTAPGETEAHRFILPAAIRMLRRSGARTALDLGCGNGAATAALASQGFIMSACDLSASGLALARKEQEQVSWFQHDVTSPLGAEHAGKYDAVVSLEVIEHLHLPRGLIANAVTALRPGGTLVLSTPFHGYWKNLALALTNKFDDHWHPLRDFGHVKFFSKRTLSALLVEHGLRIDELITVGRVGPLARSMIVSAVKPG